MGVITSISVPIYPPIFLRECLLGCLLPTIYLLNCLFARLPVRPSVSLAPVPLVLPSVYFCLFAASGLLFISFFACLCLSSCPLPAYDRLFICSSSCLSLFLVVSSIRPSVYLHVCTSVSLWIAIEKGNRYKENTLTIAKEE